MGGASSNLRSMLSEEASRVRGPRNAGEPPGLRLSEMLKFEVPDEFVGDVVINHSATLWVLDRDHDGVFSDPDIHQFADEMGKYTHGLVREDWRDYLTGNFYMQLHDDVLRPRRVEMMGDSSESESDDEHNESRRNQIDRASTKDSSRGEAANLKSYLDWITKLCVANEPGWCLTEFPKLHPGVSFVGVDTVHDLYLAFNLKNASCLSNDAINGTAFQTFLETLQFDAEQKGLMHLDVEELDDYVPLETLREWISGVMRGYRSVNVNVPGMAKPA